MTIFFQRLIVIFPPLKQIDKIHPFFCKNDYWDLRFFFSGWMKKITICLISLMNFTIFFHEHFKKFTIFFPWRIHGIILQNSIKEKKKLQTSTKTKKIFMEKSDACERIWARKNSMQHFLLFFFISAQSSMLF